MTTDNRSTFKRRDTAELFEKSPQETPAAAEPAVEAEVPAQEPLETVPENETVFAAPRKMAGRKVAATIVIIVAIVALAGLNVVQYISYEQDKETFDTSLSLFKDALEERDAILLEQYALVQSFYQQASENNWINPWIEEHVAFIPDNGERLFHRYSCPHWQSWNGSYWVFNVEYAEFLKYEPHYCW